MKNRKRKYNKCKRDGCHISATPERKDYPFCSKACRIKHERPFLTCINCNKIFQSGYLNAKFCSKSCLTKYGKESRIKNNGYVNGVATGTIGAISELMACVDLMKKGYEVFRAMSPSSHCDILAVKDGIVHLYEVRTGTYSETPEGRKLKWSNNRTQGKEMLIITYKDNKVHYIPKNTHSTKFNASVYVMEDGTYQGHQQKVI